MLFRRITEIGFPIRKFLAPHAIYTHSTTCPTRKAVCGSSKKSGDGGGGSALKLPDFKRAERSGPVRLGFVPEEWFLFFHGVTGVSGPYVLGIVLVNYLMSKEIFVMEHEYYSGLSVFAIVYLATTRLGPAAGASLDKECDAIVAGWQKGRNDEIASHKGNINAAKDAQSRAEAQKLLMDAKKENILMQLEAIYRERMMYVYRTTRGRMDYHVKRYRSEARIHQKWLSGWVLQNVRKSITPDFEKQALDSAIRDLSAAAASK